MNLFKALSGRSLLFIIVTVVRFITILAMLLLVIVEVLSIAHNVSGYQKAVSASNNATSSDALSSTTLSSVSLLLPTAATTTTTSSRHRATTTSTEEDAASILNAHRSLSATTVKATTTHSTTTSNVITFASSLVQPNAAQLASISKAAAAQASLLAVEDVTPMLRKRMHVRRAASLRPQEAAILVTTSEFDSQSASSDDDASVVYDDDCGYVAGTDIPREAGGIAFFVMHRLLTIFILLFMMASEMAFPVLSRFYGVYFPILGPEFGVGWLGIPMVWLATDSLSQVGEVFQEVAGWFTFVLGCVNVILGLILQNRIRVIRALLPDSTPDFESAAPPPRQYFKAQSEKSYSSFAHKPFTISRPYQPDPSGSHPPMYLNRSAEA